MLGIDYFFESHASNLFEVVSLTRTPLRKYPAALWWTAARWCVVPVRATLRVACHPSLARGVSGLSL